MSRRFLSIICFVSFLALVNCAGAPIHQTVPISQCVAGENCAVEGKLVVSNGRGRIEDKTGCLAVALSDSVPDDWNLERVKAMGQIYRAPSAPGLITYKIRGRAFDAEMCNSGLAMYVDRVEKTGDAH